MDTNIARCGVNLRWTIVEKPGVVTSSSGFVCGRDNGGLFILSTCHQLDSLVDNDYANVSFNDLNIRVTIFDGSSFGGTLRAQNRSADLTLVRIELTEQQLLTPPIVHIQPPLLSNEPLYKLQPICSIHNPCTDQQNHLYFQHDTGFIIDPSYVVPNETGPTRVHYYLPLVMCGSSGAPLFDRNSNRLVGMVCGANYGTTSNGRYITRRDYGISIDTIRAFFEQLVSLKTVHIHLQ